jgi:hypothetical protein
MLHKNWLQRWDSNPRTRLMRPLSYHYSTPRFEIGEFKYKLAFLRYGSDEFLYSPSLKIGRYGRARTVLSSSSDNALHHQSFIPILNWCTIEESNLYLTRVVILRVYPLLLTVLFEIGVRGWNRTNGVSDEQGYSLPLHNQQ